MNCTPEASDDDDGEDIDYFGVEDEKDDDGGEEDDEREGRARYSDYFGGGECTCREPLKKPSHVLWMVVLSRLHRPHSPEADCPGSSGTKQEVPFTKPGKVSPVVPCNVTQAVPKECLPGLVNFVTAVSYHFCLSLPAAFTQPGDHLLADPLYFQCQTLWE